MECTHVHNSIHITKVQNNRNTGTRLHWKCMEQDCGTDQGIWICTFCGHIYCGRYVNQHMLQHHSRKGKHCICVDLLTLAAFCYSCDDFITNDSPDKKLDQLRKSISTFQNHAEVKEESEEAVTEDNAKPSAVPNGRRNTRRSKKVSLVTIKRKRSPSLDNCKRVKSENDPEQNSPKFRGVGLRNLGNTCFMNAVLQSLSNIQEFRCYFEQLPSLEEMVRAKNGTKKTNNRHSNSKVRNSIKTFEDGLMAEELRKILGALWEGKGKGAISPDSLFSVIWKFVPRFRGYQQQDAHEFLICILDRLHWELKNLTPGKLCEVTSVCLTYSSRSGSPSSSNCSTSSSSSGSSVTSSCSSYSGSSSSIAGSSSYWSNYSGSNSSPFKFGICNSFLRNYSGPRSQSSIVTAIFGGTLQSELMCLSCHHESKMHEAFLDLSLDIPEANTNRKCRTKEASGQNDPICDISDCLLSFTRREELDQNEWYNCPGCKRKHPSTKKFLIRRLPNVLILHLKRFRWVGAAQAKIDSFVRFPVRALDMSDYIMTNLPETRCSKLGSNLYDLAAVIVHHGLWAGTGHYTAFAIHDGNWYHFNDSTVRLADEETVSSSKAYILFYVRREFRVS